mmetsp:Transcript_28296/g.49014  ORF Transcript_28296/g.49014 Transcript_28296/m.49014 type:complete len:82 (+) Transcript_28296:179-424(+)
MQLMPVEVKNMNFIYNAGLFSTISFKLVLLHLFPIFAQMEEHPPKMEEQKKKTLSLIKKKGENGDPVQAGPVATSAPRMGP